MQRRVSEKLSPNTWLVNEYQELVEEVKAWEPLLAPLTDAQVGGAPLPQKAPFLPSPDTCPSSHARSFDPELKSFVPGSARGNTLTPCRRVRRWATIAPCCDDCAVL